MTVIATFAILSFCTKPSMAAKVTVYGTGGINLQDGTICPKQSTMECATLEISGGEIVAVISAIKDDIDDILEKYTIVIEEMPDITPDSVIYGNEIKFKLIPK